MLSVNPQLNPRVLNATRRVCYDRIGGKAQKLGEELINANEAWRLIFYLNDEINDFRLRTEEIGI